MSHCFICCCCAEIGRKRKGAAPKKPLHFCDDSKNGLLLIRSFERGEFTVKGSSCCSKPGSKGDIAIAG